MAVRSPLKNDSGNVKEMTSAEVDQIVDQVVYQYSLNPSVSLSVVSSGGNLQVIQVKLGLHIITQVAIFKQ